MKTAAFRSCVNGPAVKGAYSLVTVCFSFKENYLSLVNLVWLSRISSQYYNQSAMNSLPLYLGYVCCDVLYREFSCLFVLQFN